jgi:hypothetical protein
MTESIKKIFKDKITSTIIEHTADSPYNLTKIIKSGIKGLYHVITEWKSEHISHRMMRPIEIIEAYPVTGFDLPNDEDKKETIL